MKPCPRAFVSLVLLTAAMRFRVAEPSLQIVDDTLAQIAVRTSHAASARPCLV